MEVNIQSIHFNSKSELNHFITEKIRKVASLFDKIESAKVTLKLERTYTKVNKICDIRLGVPGNDLHVSRQSESFESASSEAVDALMDQVKRMKSRLMGIQ